MLSWLLMNGVNVCESCRFMRVTHPIVDDLPREAAEQAGHRPACPVSTRLTPPVNLIDTGHSATGGLIAAPC